MQLLGAVRYLLRMRDAALRRCDHALQEKASQCLSLLGYTDPPKHRAVNILALDGGGIRGLVALEMLQVQLSTQEAQ